MASKRNELALVKSVDVVDDYTIKLTLKKWDSTIDGEVLYFAGNMISPQSFQANGQAWADKNPIGTGPFKFVSWTRDVGIKYQKNPNYWQQGKPYLDGIEFVEIADPMVAMAALDRREIDILESPSAKDAVTLRATGKYINIDLNYSGLGFYTVVPDSNHPNSPFADVKVRQAVAYSIDRQAIVDNILQGFGVAATQYADPNSWAHNPNIKGYNYDVNKAKQTLTQSQYPNGFKCTLYAKNTDQDSAIATALQGYLSKIGVTADIVLETDTMFNDISGDKGWNSALNVMGLRGGPDPALLIPRYYGSQGKNAWLLSVIHPADELKAIDDAVAAPDMGTKKAAMYQLQSILYDQDLISIPVYHDRRELVQYPNVHDVGMYLADDSVWTPESAWISK